MSGFMKHALPAIVLSVTFALMSFGCSKGAASAAPAAPSAGAGTKASDAAFLWPHGIAVDGAGNVYVSDEFKSTIHKITPDGVITILAGRDGTSGHIDGAGPEARFKTPAGLAADSTHNIYVVENEGQVIRKIAPGGIVTTLAGSPGNPGHADGMGAAAAFTFPKGVAVDNDGNVYVTDSNSVRKITPQGLVTTWAGSLGANGHADGTGTAARFVEPTGIFADHAGNVYVADSADNTIRKITPAGVATTLAGAQWAQGSNDGTGGAARFNSPEGITADRSGNVYVADTKNNTIRKITPNGVVTTLAGNSDYGGFADGAGKDARFRLPTSIAVDGADNLYVVDSGNKIIRKITPNGAVTTIAGTLPAVSSFPVSPEAVVAESAKAADAAELAAEEADDELRGPGGVAIDNDGNLFYTGSGNHAILKVASSGATTTLAGGADESDHADGIGAAARFSYPQGVAFDGAGNLYVADTDNNTIRKVTPAGVVSTLAGSAGQDGSADGMGAVARFWRPMALATDGAGNILVADTANNTIRKITPAGMVTTVGGSAGQPGSYDGTAATARFNFPCGVATDSAGNVFVADGINSTIRKISPRGVVTTLAGKAMATGKEDGMGAQARFHGPTAMATDSAGNVYVGDTGNQRIRRISPEGKVTTLVHGEEGQAFDVLVYQDISGKGIAADVDARAITLDRAGNLYALGAGGIVVKVSPAGKMATVRLGE